MKSHKLRSLASKQLKNALLAVLLATSSLITASAQPTVSVMACDNVGVEPFQYETENGCETYTNHAAYKIMVCGPLTNAIYVSFEFSGRTEPLCGAIPTEMPCYTYMEDVTASACDGIWFYPSGPTNATVIMEPKDDCDDAEGDEDVTLTITTPPGCGYTIGCSGYGASATIWIKNIPKYCYTTVSTIQSPGVIRGEPLIFRIYRPVIGLISNAATNAPAMPSIPTVGCPDQWLKQYWLWGTGTYRDTSTVGGPASPGLIEVLPGSYGDVVLEGTGPGTVFIRTDYFATYCSRPASGYIVEEGNEIEIGPGKALLNGLKGYWKLDETSTTGTRYDSTAADYDLTVFNEVQFSTNGLNGSASFSASSQDEGLHTQGTNAQTALTFSGAWTVSCWVNRSSPVYDSDNIFSKPGEIYFWRGDNNNQLRLYIMDGGTNYNELLDHEFDYSLPQNQWHHLLLRRTTNAIELFVDGAFEESVAFNDVVHDGGEDFWIGMQNAGYPWNGLIDEFGYWARSLNTNEISALYGSGSRPAFSTFDYGVTLLKGLKGYWKLDETNSAGTRFDSSTNSYDLSVFNAVQFSTNGLNGSASFDASMQDEGLYAAGTNAAAALAFTNSWTVSCWVHRGETVYGADNIFTKGGELYFWWDILDDALHLYATDGTTNQVELLNHAFDSTVPENEWRHLVLRRHGNTIDLFVNGDYAESVAISGSIQNAGYDFWIGMQLYGWPWNGLIDECGYWGRALHSAEIRTLYGNGSRPAFETFTQ